MLCSCSGAVQHYYNALKTNIKSRRPVGGQGNDIYLKDARARVLGLYYYRELWHGGATRGTAQLLVNVMFEYSILIGMSFWFRNTVHAQNNLDVLVRDFFFFYTSRNRIQGLFFFIIFAATHLGLNWELNKTRQMT